MSLKKTNMIITFVILTNVLVIVLWVAQHYTKYGDSVLRSYTLGNMTQCGYIGVKLTYDKEPVDIIFTSPSGRTITKDYFSVYELDENHKQITALIDSSDLGEWFVSFDKKSNKNIKYQLITESSPTLYLTNVKLTEIDGLPYLTFLPLMNDDDNEQCNYAISMNNGKHFYVLDNGKINLNEQAYILIEPKEEAYDGTKYTIRIAIQSLDEKQSSHEDIVVILQNKQTSIQQIDEEPNYNSTDEDITISNTPSDNKTNNEDINN